jgi:FKBP-type peptidyl-prolyl cis-trans isomerase FkpA
MNTVKNLLLFVFAAAILVSCGKTSYKKTPGGMPYKVFAGKDTQKVVAGSFIKLHLTQKIKDSVYFTSEGTLPIYFQVNAATQPYDLSEVWTKLKVGDSMVATQMMDTFINRSPQNIPPQFKKGDRIITYVKILGVFASDSAAKADEEKGKKDWLAGEIKTVEKYLADKKITAQRTPSGAFVEIINPGTGNLADTGNYVTVNYTGISWSGVKFDSNTDTAFHHVAPYSFEAGVGKMSKGFDEAILLLRKGGKGKIYVPSLLAYGPQPGTPLIKPYENLMFDIELVDIKDKAPAQPTGPQQPGQQPVNMDRPQQ